MSPEEAALAAEFLGVRYAIGTHYVDPEDEDVRRFLEAVPAADTTGSRIPLALVAGQTLVIDGDHHRIDEPPALSLPPTRVGVIGAGFWAGFQLAAWAEHADATVVAIANRSLGPARALAERFGIEGVYDDPRLMIEAGGIDVVDVITAPDSHAAMIRLAADAGLAVICQKPLAPTLEVAREMVAYAESRDVRLLVHENFRWQAPIRELARALRAGAIGRPFRARLEFTTGFPVFDNQPFLKRSAQVHPVGCRRPCAGCGPVPVRGGKLVVGADPDRPGRCPG